jgi:anti-sigma factor RsiW
MTGPDCAEMHFLLQADADGELTAAEAARLAAHLQSCDACRRAQNDLLALSARLRTEATRHAAPAALRDAVRVRLASAPTLASAVANENRSAPPRAWRWPGIAAGAGIAACLALLLISPRTDTLPDQLVAGHIRALQPGHLIDVISTDQHTVKPWFDGRLDYAPPVRDFKADGFPLAGGRLDYLANRPVAALIYHRRLHVIDLYVWPAGTATAAPATGARDGYNFVSWHQAGMVFWAVSDLNADELAAFARLWQAG